ncbi:nitrite reductase small subunit NirD [Aliivibrio salmonicida]|uniref:nitrite reductase small subunit NirD n=1 Tax=Aliivibrio salmonicida TaxID=40269 RepID=UPI0003264623|nr:nitrite reductase small subunit NirD [Aliivibrio salmonicida]AZL86426.1 nitrite reductase small subunit NirD [Aliivibrio salmonicida]
MSNWITICKINELTPQLGACAKVLNHQVAVFYCKRSERLYALSNYDPIGKANVISRGMMGSLEGEPYISSPLYKHHFHLETGVCIEFPEVILTTYPVRMSDNQIQIKLAH